MTVPRRKAKGNLIMKSIGTKYESTKGLSRAQIAKLIREDIKSAVKAGTLPKAKYYVRTREYAGGGSIDISFAHVEEAGFQLFNVARIEHDMKNPHDFTTMPIYSDRAREITDALEAISGVYNFNDSDSQSDYFHVRFYGHAKVEWQWERDERKAFVAKVAAGEVSSKPARPHLTLVKPAPAPAPKPAQVAWLEALGAL